MEALKRVRDHIKAKIAEAVAVIEATDSRSWEVDAAEETILRYVELGARAKLLQDLGHGLTIKQIVEELADEADAEITEEDRERAEAMWELAGEHADDYALEDAAYDVREQLEVLTRDVEARKDKLEKLMELERRFAWEDSTFSQGGETNMTPEEINSWQVARAAKRQKAIERVLA